MPVQLTDAEANKLRDFAHGILAIVNAPRANGGAVPVPPVPHNLRIGPSKADALSNEGRAWLKEVLLTHGLSIRKVQALSGISAESIMKYRDRWLADPNAS